MQTSTFNPKTSTKFDLRDHTGIISIIIGIGHCSVGLMLYREKLMEMVNAGLFNTVDTLPGGDGAFWFMFAGLTFFVIGTMLRWAQRITGTVPAAPGWILLVIGLVGAFMMPASGFWLAIGFALLIIFAARKGRTAAF